MDIENIYKTLKKNNVPFTTWTTFGQKILAIHVYDAYTLIIDNDPLPDRYDIECYLDGIKENGYEVKSVVTSDLVTRKTLKLLFAMTLCKYTLHKDEPEPQEEKRPFEETMPEYQKTNMDYDFKDPALILLLHKLEKIGIKYVHRPIIGSKIPFLSVGNTVFEPERPNIDPEERKKYFKQYGYSYRSFKKEDILSSRLPKILEDLLEYEAY